jgi:hypothetical protein
LPLGAKLRMGLWAIVAEDRGNHVHACVKF